MGSKSCIDIWYNNNNNDQKKLPKSKKQIVSFCNASRLLRHNKHIHSEYRVNINDNDILPFSRHANIQNMCSQPPCRPPNCASFFCHSPIFGTRTQHTLSLVLLYLNWIDWDEPRLSIHTHNTLTHCTWLEWVGILWVNYNV